MTQPNRDNSEKSGIVFVSAPNLPAAWEESIVSLYNNGVEIKTQYDKPDDPPSIDATAMIEILDPFAEPRIHRCFPDSITGLEAYRQEVTEGIRDSWIAPDEGKWSYSYFSRLRKYTVPGIPEPIDQIQYVIDSLKECAHSRRAQAVTWKAWEDSKVHDPACFCAGTLIETPMGQIPIENLKNGDEVYAYDLENNSVVSSTIKNYFSRKSETYSISLLDREINVSHDQLLRTTNGWIKAKDIKNGDLLIIPTICSGTNVTDQMIVGFMHGDGWLSSGFCGGKRKIKRCDVSFSLHPSADNTCIFEYLKNNSNNKISDKTKYVKSKMVQGFSRNITITDRQLYTKLNNLGCPVGHKIGQKIIWDVNSHSIDECIDFLTGIFSAEGSIILNAHSHSASIQLGMIWKECMELICSILDKVNIQYTYYPSYNNKTYSIRIDRIEEIEKAINTFDFRLDSRKQAKYLLLKSSILSSKLHLESRIENIDYMRTCRKNGLKHKELRQMKNFSSIVLLEDYSPTLRFKTIDNQCSNTFVALPVQEIIKTNKAQVYDFEIDHKDHAMIANGIVAHNCLQRMWFRVINDKLQMNVHMRSNDAFKANFMNMFGFTDLQRIVAEAIEVPVGKYIHIVDSFHLYGSYATEIEGFFKTLKARTFEERTYRTDDPMIIELFDEAKVQIAESLQREKETGRKGL